VGAGCDHCWAARMASRFSFGSQRPAGLPSIIATGLPEGAYTGFAWQGKWTGRVDLIERELGRPVHWRKPRTIAVGLMGDWMHEALPDEARDRILAVEALCPQHTFIHLTKRWKRQAEYFKSAADRVLIPWRARWGDGVQQSPSWCWPIPNLIIGATAWDQASAAEAWRWLAQTPAACRLLCLEPLLAHVNIPEEALGGSRIEPDDPTVIPGAFMVGRGLDWVIVGGESGPGARPMHPEWVRRIRDDCQAAGVPFWFKQWGEWGQPEGSYIAGDALEGKVHWWPQGGVSTRVGKKAAGRMLDGREWNGAPDVATTLAGG